MADRKYLIFIDNLIVDKYTILNETEYELFGVLSAKTIMFLGKTTMSYFFVYKYIYCKFAIEMSHK